jgi:CubicO group peptidase (beta-lactamase class C family)
VEEQTRKHINNYPNGLTAEQIDMPPYYPITRNDWVAGYGYQTWRNTIGGFRADGAWGQMIIVLPEKNAVIAARAQLANHQVELWSFWDLLVPYL